MQSVRAFWRSHWMLAALVLAAALLLRAAVPSGYMISSDSGGLRVSLCSGASLEGLAPGSDARAAIGKLQAIAAMNKAAQEPVRAAAKVCPYATLTAASLGGADLVLLAAALAFVLALGFAAATLPPARRIAFLRPPLRAPPAPF